MRLVAAPRTQVSVSRCEQAVRGSHVLNAYEIAAIVPYRLFAVRLVLHLDGFSHEVGAPHGVILRGLYPFKEVIPTGNGRGDIV